MQKKKKYTFNLNFLNLFNQKNFGTLPRMLISSLIIISFFYSMPIIVGFSKNKSNVYKNNSKAVLAYTLNGQVKDPKKNAEVLDETDLLKDIFSLNDLETDTVRLNASTIRQLFEDTEYSLKTR